jgi:E3 ubiquitin-protein ligase HUWE1
MSIVGNGPQVRAQRLLSFVHSHKGVLNLLVHARPALLEGSFSALIKVSQLRSYLGFNSKRKYFFSQLRKRRPEYGRRSVHLQLRRGQVFEDSFHQLRMRTSEEMRGRLQVNFHGEEGIDIFFTYAVLFF